jgi:predicted aspartyl protease
MKVAVIAAAISVSIPLASPASTVVPTSYEAGHFIATPTTASGKVLRLNVDTGGPSAYMTLKASVATPLNLKPASCFNSDAFAEPPTYAKDKGLPPLGGHRCNNIMILPDQQGDEMTDGAISAWYLVKGIWTFDYPARRLTLEDSTWKAGQGARAVSLGFPIDANGEFETPYPRIVVGISGEQVNFLLDTGATAHPSEAGKAAMKTDVAANGFAAGSYITTTVMNRWHTAHPDWPLLDAADDLFGGSHPSRAIRVPSVVIGGWQVGPIWFTERADQNFDAKVGLSSYMDETVDGALGGNALSAFRMTMDYRHRKVWFACVKGCTLAD